MTRRPIIRRRQARGSMARAATVLAAAVAWAPSIAATAEPPAQAAAATQEAPEQEAPTADDATAQSVAASEGTASDAAGLDFFERRVRPLLVARCYECHSAAAEDLMGGLRLDSRAGVQAGGDTGAVVVPGDPEGSLLVEAVRYDGDRLQMPPDGKLADADIETLVRWVERGAPYPDGDAAAPPAREGIDYAAGRRFWSFQPPRPAPLPAVSDPAWPRGRIDSFVLAELNAHGLTPSPQADRRTLIRRVSFDLVGLPPTPDEVAAFVADERPDAYERLVDRLLASPQHGQRAARRWLDLARYTDVQEPWVEEGGQAWLYRDWVVRAFNDDMPYDEFVRRQLAVDLMPGTLPADRVALGFLGLSPTYWKELKLAPAVIETIVAEEWEERIDAVTRTFLGLTAACARCHDHKYDPIGTQDYYALAGVLASAQPAAVPLLPEAEARTAAQARDLVKSLEGRIAALRGEQPVPPEKEQQAAELEALAAHVRRSTPHYDAPLAPGVVEAAVYVVPDGPDRTKVVYHAGEARDVPLHVRGSPANPGPVVPRRFLQVLSADPPPAYSQGSGRLELAESILREGAPLASRVIVNRVWREHFGRGLVETPSNFGTQGARPSHPALLDDLAARFMADGWSIKRLRRQIVLSATYRQSSGHDAARQAVDPDNRWLWRMARRRLDVEAWRDAMLAAAGTLDLRAGGPPGDLADPANRRRTLYGTVDRRDLDGMLRLHDFPDPEFHSEGREMTVTPLQQLFALNSPLVEAQAAALAARVRGEAAGVEAQVARAYALLLGREPTATEIGWAVDFLRGGDARGEGPADASADAQAGPVADPRGDAGDALWRQYAQALLASNEFAFVD